MLKLIIHFFREIRENQKSKARKTHRSRWGQPKEREREKKQSRDAKAITHYLPQADRPLGLWAITLERQNSGFAAAHDVIGYPISLTLSGISFWPPEIHYSGRVFSQLPAHPQPTYWGGRVRQSLCKPCLAIARALVWHQHSFGHRSDPQHHRGCCEG